MRLFFRGACPFGSFDGASSVVSHPIFSKFRAAALLWLIGALGLQLASLLAADPGCGGGVRCADGFGLLLPALIGAGGFLLAARRSGDRLFVVALWLVGAAAAPLAHWALLPEASGADAARLAGLIVAPLAGFAFVAPGRDAA